MDGYLLGCSALFVCALVVNATDFRMLWLTILVGIGYYWPQPESSAAAFYASCIATEMAVGIAAYFLDRKRGLLVGEIALLLAISHLMGFVLDGNPPFSPYHFIVRLLEFSQIVACVALSPVIAPILRNRDEAVT